MVEWLAGNRIRGTSTEKPTLALDGVGGWVELGRATAGSSDSSLAVSSLPDKRYYMFLTSDYGHSTAQARLIRYNSDSGSNYSRSQKSNGGADNTAVNQTADNGFNANNVFPQYAVHYMSNVSSKEKLHISQGVSGNTGAGSIPNRTEFAGKWTNTSSVVNKIDYIQNAGTHVSGSELVVLGWDPEDTHTTNFWEELASVAGTGSSTTLDSGTFTAKKYLWVQIYLEGASNMPTQLFRYNSDSGNNYSQRSQRNGATDVTNVNISHGNVNVTGGANQKGIFYNGFIINNSANEKLGIFNGIGQNTAGAGTAPVRVENVHKWANTSSQITSIQILQDDAVNYGTNSIIKVWGSD